MKKLYLRIAMALLGLAGLGVTANAQVVDQVVVTVPFDFVVGNTTLPAGTYHVHRVADDPWEGLVLSSYENHVATAVIPTEVKNVSTKKPLLSFETAGNEHFLNRIQTANNVFDIRVSKGKFTEALAHNNTSSFGSSGGN